jgi:ADP-heptose:LPS heptosyltransferase
MKAAPKVLIIRFSSLGDIVLTSLLVRCVKNQLDGEIHYLTKKPFASVLATNPYVHKVWLLDRPIQELAHELKRENFDLIIDLHKNIRSYMVRWLLGRTPVVSYYKGNWEKWLAVYGKKKIQLRHIALRYLDAVARFGVRDDGAGLDFFIHPNEKMDLGKFNLVPPYIALVIGAAHFTKRIPEVKLNQLISKWKDHMPVALIGGPAEADFGEKWAGTTVINLCGKLTIAQSASILSQSALVICPDTGMMHIAAALQKPIFSIWGSTLAEFGFWPFYGNRMPDQNQSFEVKNLSCRPCARFGRQACPKGHFNCMMQQDVELLYTKALERKKN